MERQLPIVAIDGVEFYVDVLRDELWQLGCPENSIPFDAFQAVDHGYYFLYNRKTCQWVWDKTYIDVHPEEHCVVMLPALMELDPEGMALHYEIPLEILCPKSMPVPPKWVVAALYPLSYRYPVNHSKLKV